MQKELPIKDNDQGHTHRNAAVSNVENGSEKLKPIAAFEGDPFRKAGINHGKVKHVYHPALEKRGVTCTKWDHGSQTTVVIRLRENEAVKHAVQDIADGTGDDERKTYDESGGFAGFDHHSQKINQKANHDNAESAQ